MSGIANGMRNPGFRLSIHPGEYKKEGTIRRDISSKAGINDIHNEITLEVVEKI